MPNELPFRTHIVRVDIPADGNIIFGQSHFIKTVEDIYEAMVSSGTAVQFGIAFCEASGKRLIRTDGNNTNLIEMAQTAAAAVGCGHTFFIYMRGGFPINVLNRIKQVQEVCRIFCATANPLEILVAETSLGRGVLGVVDGEIPLGVESEPDKKERTEFLRKIGYKR